MPENDQKETLCNSDRNRTQPNASKILALGKNKCRDYKKNLCLKKNRIPFSPEPILENNHDTNRENKRFINKHFYEKHHGIK